MNIKLAHFELLEELGHGGLGIVFRAFDPSLNRFVAIKVLKDDFAQDPQFVDNFLRESRNAAAISHPHIAQVHFVGEHEGNYYLVMELIAGRSLEQIVREDGPMSEAKALRVAIEVTEALKAGYVNQMIHGDIKPQNIVVGEECGAKLLDFGLAQLANVEVDATGSIWGSPYYISPERVGRKAEDFRSDIYSLGATIFEMLVGHPPFEAEDPTQLALKRLNEKPPLLRTLNPNISKRTEQIIDKMLHKNLLMRYLDYDALLKELRKAEAAALGNASLTDTMDIRRTTGYITAPVQVPTPRSLLPTILAVSLASCLAVGGVGYFLVAKKTASQPAASAASSPAPSAGPTPLSMKNGSKIVKFRYINATAREVSLVGNFDMWQPEPMKRDQTSPDTWVIDKEIPLGVAIEYQFIADGKSLADPVRKGLSFPDGKGSFKTIWDPSATPTPSAQPAPTRVAAAKPATPTPSPTPFPTTSMPKVLGRIIYEGFDLPETNKIALSPASPTEIGLTGTWSGPNGGGKIIAPGLTYPGMTCTGNAVQFANSISSFRSIDMKAMPAEITMVDVDGETRLGKPGSTLWVRVLMRVDAPDATGTACANVNLLGPSSGGGCKLGIGVTGSSNSWGLIKGKDVAASNVPIVSGSTVLLVTRIKFIDGRNADEADLFVNPPLGPQPPAKPDATMRDMHIGCIDRIDFRGTRESTADEFSIATEWEKPATASVASANAPAADPDSPFQRTLKNCNRLLADFNVNDATKEFHNLVASTPDEEAQMTAIQRRVSGQTTFKKKLEEDLAAKGYPLPVDTRDGKRLIGGVKMGTGGVIVISAPGGEIRSKLGELTAASLLAMSDYFTQKETQPDQVGPRNWTNGIAAVSLGLKAEGKALMEKALADKAVQKAFSRAEMERTLGR